MQTSHLEYIAVDLPRWWREEQTDRWTDWRLKNNLNHPKSLRLRILDTWSFIYFALYSYSFSSSFSFASYFKMFLKILKLWYPAGNVNILKIIMKSLHMLHLRSKFLLIIIIQWKTLKIVKKMILNSYEDKQVWNEWTHHGMKWINDYKKKQINNYINIIRLPNINGFAPFFTPNWFIICTT